jgi:hypothetical protein
MFIAGCQPGEMTAITLHPRFDICNVSSLNNRKTIQAWTTQFYGPGYIAGKDRLINVLYTHIPLLTFLE